MLQTVFVSLLSLFVGFIILQLLIDGIFQDGFPELIMDTLQQLGYSYESADEIYGRVFMENKDLFLVGGFILLFLIFFYIAMSRLTRYLDDIGVAVDNIIADSEESITLNAELKPISDKLNTLKMTLRRREKEAQDSEQRKNDLVVYLAHDIKTPLTSIIAYLTMLDEQPQMSIEERAKYTHISLEKAIRLGELINEFFEITKFNLQDIMLEKESVNISIMLEQLADESYGVLNKKHQTCSVKVEDDLIVNGDADKLARVFDNLLRNAIAYSYQGTSIDIQAYLENETIVIHFTNQGDTIPQKKLMSIFDKFYRVDNARSSHTGGAGLGLSIAKEIVELHAGTIEAFSYTGNIRFTVRLPKYILLQKVRNHGKTKRNEKET